jgi:tetratricopeptide (TPR) repeat protein
VRRDVAIAVKTEPVEAPRKEEDPLAIFAHEAGEPIVPKRPSNLPPDRLQGILDAAQMLAGKGKKPEALVKYKEVLESDPAHAEAIAWVEDYLRSKRDYQQLKDVLLASVRALGTRESIDSKKERLREVAGLCEGNLRDVDGAISAWRQLIALDRSDESARNALTRLLERSQRWDDLANLLEQEATVEVDIETKIALEKKLARLQEDKRKDLIGAAEAWARIARLTPEAEGPIATSAKLYERAERLDLAAQMLSDHAPTVEDPLARGNLLERLANLREQIGDLVAAGHSYAEAADALRNGRLWEEAERLYAASEQWKLAATAATQRGGLTSDAKQEALYLSKAADYLTRAGSDEEALEALEKATDLDPLNDGYADQVAERFSRTDQTERLVAFLSRRGERLVDRQKRIATRRQAAALATSKLRDREVSRELWLKVLEDGDDKEALERLIDDAVEREDHTEATTLLRRLSQTTVDKAEKSRVALREAELLAEGVGDIDTALSRYEEILAELDPTCRPALQAIADLQEKREDYALAADALERELKLLADALERGQIASRLARLYEQLDDPKSAIRALDIVRKADLEDFDALTRLCELCERTEQWDRVAELLAERIEIEGDEDEAAQMTMKLARILADKLDRGDEALAALTEFADQGNPDVRTAYVELGDRLGWKGVVAQKLVDWWFDSRHNADRTSALRSAFDRFAEVGRDQDAVRVAIELVRTKGADKDVARGLEQLAVKTSDQDALTVAHEMLARESTGPERAFELVRQAEVKAKAGVSAEEALSHGEEGLSSIAPSEAEPLLERLAKLSTKPVEVVDLYERQISRSKAAPDRMRALARAAQVAAQRGQPERARSFYELALGGVPSDETLSHLETTAREGDSFMGGDRLRRALANALASGGTGSRDGGKTRSSLLRRAAQIAHRDLNDVDLAFRWLGDSLVALVDSATVDELEKLGLEVSDPRRTEAALSHALGEVFDGPLVRLLLSRRARLRRDQLVDKTGAAQDLKKLHDLSPSEHKVTEELSRLLIDLGDFKGLVQLYEDQILRGKDVGYRAELARKVARIWEEQLGDAREAADAWRRVLRMKAGDAEATAGLERAKKNELRKSSDTSVDVYLPPPPPAGGDTTSLKPPAVAATRSSMTASAATTTPPAAAPAAPAPPAKAPAAAVAPSPPKSAPPPPLAPTAPPAATKPASVPPQLPGSAVAPAVAPLPTEPPPRTASQPPREELISTLDALEQTRNEEPKATTETSGAHAAPVGPSSQTRQGVAPPARATAAPAPTSPAPARGATQKAPISNILDEEIALSLEKLGESQERADRDDVIDADDLAELVDTDDGPSPN